MSAQNGVPKEGGLLDLRLGTTERGLLCRTCGCTELHCPGHFGHVELCKPVFHIGFMPFVLKVLRCVCYHCGRLLLSPQDNKYREAAKIRDPMLRLNTFVKMCSGKRVCGAAVADEDAGADADADLQLIARGRASGCGGMQPKYRRQGITIDREFKEDAQQDASERKAELPAWKVHEIFKMIKNDTCEVLGLNPHEAHPSWFVTTVLPVPPPPVRPSVTMDSSNSSQDDITHLLGTVVKVCARCSFGYSVNFC